MTLFTSIKESIEAPTAFFNGKSTAQVIVYKGNAIKRAFPHYISGIFDLHRIVPYVIYAYLK